MVTQKSAAFFDFDKTLIRGDSQSLECRFILGSENPSFRYLISLACPALTGILAITGLMSQETHNRSYVRTYKGRCRQELIDRGEKLFNTTLRERFIPKSLEIFNQHRLKGHKVVIVSATPRHLIEPVARHLAPDDVICTELEYGKDRYCTGRSLGRICMGSGKAERIRQYAAEHRIDLAVCHAYSDHHADLPFLEAVGHPRVINPTTRLFEIARKRDWPVYHHA